MTNDRVHPASKPQAAATAAIPTFSTKKAQLYDANYPRPPPGGGSHRRRHNRGCCCRCCCWTILLTILLLLLVAAASTVIYLIYRPHRPSFAISSLKISALNFTSSTHLATAISIAIVSRNPNKNVEFLYDDTAISVTSSGDDGIIIGRGSFPAFVHGNKNTTLLKISVRSPTQDLDEISANQLKGEIKSKKGLQMKIVLDTKVRVKMGSLKTPKTGVRVTCNGIKATAPTSKTATTAATSGATCKVDLRFKIWKITI